MIGNVAVGFLSSQDKCSAPTRTKGDCAAARTDSWMQPYCAYHGCPIVDHEGGVLESVFYQGQGWVGVLGF